MNISENCLARGLTYISYLRNDVGSNEDLRKYLNDVFKVTPLYVEYYSDKSEHRTASMLVADDPDSGVNPSMRYELYDPLIRRMAEIQNGVVVYEAPSKSRILSSQMALLVHAYVHSGKNSLKVNEYPSDYPFVFYKAPLVTK